MLTLMTKAGERYRIGDTEEMSLEVFLKKAKKDKSLYEGPADRLLRAIGEPEIVDTSKDERLRRIYRNKKIKVYKSFEDFYGMEDAVDNIVNFLKSSSQGLEERKQILYLLGPPGGGKSSLSERVKELMETQPVYVLKHKSQISPVFESPLGLFKPEDHKELGIPVQYLKYVPSPWALKRLREDDGDISKFSVMKIFPSRLYQRCISKTEAGDEQNQDISSLVGKLDIRKVADFSPADPDSYSFSGGLCLGNRGLMEFVEMFKAPFKTLHPLLTATQDRNYNGTEPIGSIPFEGIVLAHSNESEWKSFKNNPKNEALLDRIYLVPVPYVTRVSAEEKIYQKLLKESSLDTAPCAPKTTQILAEFMVLSRLKADEEHVTKTDDLFLKMKAYDGQNLKDKYARAKSVKEYKDLAGPDEGLDGLSTRLAFKLLSRTFNRDPYTIEADPPSLFLVIADEIRTSGYEDAKRSVYNSFYKILEDEYYDFIEKEIQHGLMESDNYAQNLFDRYVAYADHWINEEDYPDPDTGRMSPPEKLEKFLEEIEKAGGIANPKDFRHEVVNHCLRYKANHKGKSLKWNSYNKMERVIREKVFHDLKDLTPHISFDPKEKKSQTEEHHEFVKRMEKKGYTKSMLKRVVNWYQERAKK